MPVQTHECVNQAVNQAGRVREQIGVFAGRKILLEKVLSSGGPNGGLLVQRASAFVDRADRADGADGERPLTQIEKFGMRFPGTVPAEMSDMVRKSLRSRVFPGDRREIGEV